MSLNKQVFESLGDRYSSISILVYFCWCSWPMSLQMSQDAEPSGEIFLHENDWVDTNVPHTLSHHAHIFMLHTSGREGGGFPLLAMDSVVRDAWMSAINNAIESVKKCPAVFTFRKNYFMDEFSPSASKGDLEQSLLSPPTSSSFRYSDIWDPPV